MKTGSTALSLGLTALAISASAQATPYPPNYVFWTQCENAGPFRVCRQGGKQYNLVIRYEGELARKYPELKIWVKLNGREGKFTVRPDAFDSAKLFLTSGYTQCWSSGPTGSDIQCQSADQATKNLFFYAENQYRTNAWDIELAVENGNGEWDSNLGQNYRVRFEQR